MKVGILGSGEVGQALGRGFASRGHDVKIASRTPKSEALAKWTTQAKGKTSTGTFAATAKHGEILVLAALGSAVEEVLRLAGPPNMAGKVLIDVTNPLDFSQGPNPGLFIGPNDSLGERVQRRVPEAKVVKCFNTVSNTQMVDPKFAGGNPEMMICGDDAAAKKTVAGILKEFGWPGTIDIGGVEGARWRGGAVPLWGLVGSQVCRGDHALKVLHRRDLAS